MKNFSTNWKTTLGGGVTAAIGIASLFGVKIGAQAIDPTTAFGMITVQHFDAIKLLKFAVS